jgi:hypothetical protein
MVTTDHIEQVTAKNVEVIQAEIVGHSDLYLCALFLTVHDKLTCEVSSTWTKYSQTCRNGHLCIMVTCS